MFYRVFVRIRRACGTCKRCMEDDAKKYFNFFFIDSFLVPLKKCKAFWFLGKGHVTPGTLGKGHVTPGTLGKGQVTPSTLR